MAKPQKLMNKKAAPTKKRGRANSRKEDIMKAAANLFSQKTYHDVTMDQIAEEVGIAKGTIYLYFESKENLYLGILEHTHETIESILVKEIEKNDPAPQKLKKVLTLIFQFYFQNRDVLRILTRDETRLIREHFDFTERWRHRRIKLYRKILEKGIKEGSFRPANTELMALIIFGLVGSVMSYYPKDMTAGEIAEEVFSMISEGIMTSRKESTLGERGL